MYLSLRTRIWLLIAGTVSGLAIVIVLAITNLARQETNRTVRGDVRATGNVMAQFLRERSQGVEEQLTLLARQPSLKEYIQRSDGATLKDLAEDYRQQLHADSTLLTDRDGLVMGETDTVNSFRQDRHQESGITEALRGEKWRGVIMRHGQMTLAVTVPIVIGPEVWGTLSAYTPINAEMAKELKGMLSGSEVAFVVRGKVMGASLSLPITLPTPETVPTLETIVGRDYYALYAPLPNTEASSGLGYVVLRPYDLAMATYLRFRTALTLIVSLILLLALVAGAMVARSITRPLDGVISAAHVLQKGDWPRQFTVRRKDEIGLLQTVFNEMTTAMRASQERLLALIDTDPLTGLDNHRRLHERLAQETKRSVASNEPLTLLLFDLDHFQQYNQRLGHSSGDAALQQVAMILQNGLPDIAICGRYGGEEFAAILSQYTLDQSEALAEKIRQMFRDIGLGGEQGDPLTLSVGCAEFGTHTTQAEGLLLAAELAVSRAKQLGRDRVCRFDSVPGADETADPYQLHRFLKDGSIATIQALAAAVDAKDAYTQGHSRRVAEYASALAAFIRLSEAEVELVYTTGTLHDVGKIGVPDSILKKPGRLDDDERTIMETHPVLGEVIVRKAPQLSPTLPGVRHHHERWDGKGYPDRLAGENIPQVARLLAVADTFDAMTSDRPYRKGLDWNIALDEIAKGAGTQFDPTLAEAFVQLMRHQAQERAHAA